MGRETTPLGALANLFIPGGVLLGAAWALQHEPLVREAAAPYAAFFAFGTLSTAILLCWYHDHSRLLAGAVAVALTVTALTRWPESANHPTLLLVFLLPFTFVLVAALREDGVITPSGLTKLAGAAIPAVVFLGMRDGRYTHAASLLQQSGALVWPVAVRASFAAGVLALLGLALWRRGKVEQGLLWAMVAVFLGVEGMRGPQTLLLYAGAAGLVLVLTALDHGYDIAYRDELTGLLGRRAFNTMMGQLGRTYAIAICDVDRFKNFNDSYGHDAGDQVLRMVAAKLSQVGGGGRVFRYGGEEFLVVFRGRSAQEAAPFAEAVRKAVADARFVLRGPDRPARKLFRVTAAKPSSGSTTSVGITISIGLAERSRRHSTPELVLDAADAALYGAKESGRNCVRIADCTTADHRAAHAKA
jgi:diguanylate cyclase (GGDEF)-like protein